jgi:trimethylamine--corrinoid protein Co-methyltransferase
MAFRYHCKNPLKVVSDDEIKKIHEATLQVLEDVGVKFEDEEALNLLADHGCRVDHKSMVAKFPPSLVEDSLKKCPSEFTLHARNPKYDLVFDADSVYFGACGGMEVLDLETMQRRPGTSKDAVEAAILCDALGNITTASPGVFFVVDQPLETNLEWIYATAMRNSEKVTCVAVMDDSEKWGLRMAQAIGEDIFICPSSASPLGWTGEQIGGVKLATGAGLPVGVQSMATPGATAPATIAGTAVVMNAETLAMVVLAELLRPGTGVLYSCFTMPMDMQTATLASGSMEFGMLTALSAQLAKFYGIHTEIFQPQTDSKLFDEQAGYEKAMQWLLAGMSGINWMWGAGMVEGQTLWSNAQLIVEAEMCGMVGRYLEGVGVADETLVVDLIKEVGHFPNNYLGKRHTREWWMREQYRPIVSSREGHSRWMEMGAKDALARADEKAKEILKKHEPVPLSREVDREVEKLLQAAAKEKGIV